MPSTRTVTGKYLKSDGSAWAAATGTVTLLSENAIWGDSLLKQDIAAVSDGNGDVSVAIPVPDSDAWAWIWKLPDGQTFRFALDAGAATTIAALQAAESTTTTADELTNLIANKMDKVTPAADNNIAVLDLSTGAIEDGGQTIASIGGTQETKITAAVSAAATTIPVLDGNAANVGDWIILEPYSTDCELRKITGISANTLTVAALTNAHADDSRAIIMSAPVWHAEHFGVVANDSTNDIAAWTALVADIGLAGGGLVVTPYGGTSLIETALVINQNNVTIEGRGGFVLKQTDTSTDARTVQISGDNVTLRGFGIDGNYDDGTTDLRYAIELTSTASIIRIINMDLQNSLSACVRINGANDVLIQGCGIHDMGDSAGGDAIYMTSGGGSPSKNIRVMSNHFYDCGRTAAVLIHCEDVIIANNYCSGGSNSVFDIEPNTASDFVKRVTISNNVAVDNGVTKSAGIGCDAGTQDNIQDVTITGNVLMIDEYALTASKAKRLTIAGNIFICKSKASVSYLLRVNDVKQLAIEGNTLIDLSPLSTVDGMLVEGSLSAGARVVGNHIVDAGRYGLNISSARAIVSGNVIDNNGGDYGINLTTNNAQCSDNVIIDANNIGILVNGSDCFVTGNRIYDSGGRGIFANSNADRSLVANNLVDNPGSIGIHCQLCDQIMLTGNKVQSASLQGFSIENLIGAVLNGNEARDNSGDGFRASNTAQRVTFNGNLAVDNVNDGFYIEGDDITLVGNIAYDTGAAVQNYGVNISGNCDYLMMMGNNFRNNNTGARTGSTPSNYKPNPNGTFATDMGNFNFE